MPIFFYSRIRQYAWLSNFSRHGFTLAGVRWPSVEHYYQAQKFAGTEMAEQIRQAVSPLKARKAGRNCSLALRSDWDEAKEVVMRRAIRAKFEQNGWLQRLLLATGDEELIHYSSVDLFWGRNEDGVGDNRLGAIITEVRQSFRQSA